MKNLPLGTQHFDELRERDAIYVDKTQQIVHLVRQYKAVFLSRPRRFGKSLLLSTIAQLFQGRKDLFTGLWAENNWDWGRKHPVVHIYMDKTGFRDVGLKKGLMAHLDGIAAQHDMVLQAEGLAARFIELIETLRQRQGQRVVVLIDEYDKPMLDVLGDAAQVEENRQILGEFYGILKPVGDSIQFLMLTGVSKFSQVSLFSRLNQLRDITLDHNYATLLGYTQSEMETYFDGYLQAAQQKIGTSREAMLEKLRHWYNGYTWDFANRVYNPVSVMNFCADASFQNYWFATGTPTFLVEQITRRQEFNLEKLETSQRAFESYTPDHIQLPSLMFQTGYLTLREKTPYDTWLLDYPNHEVREALTEHLIAAYGNLPELSTTGPTVFKLREAFYRNDMEEAISIINTLFENIPGTLARKNVEADYHAMLFLVFRYMGLNAEAEVSGLRGRSDAVLKTPSQVFVIEFKLNQSGAAAVQHIREKGYAERYRHDGRPVTLLGISFGTEERMVTDWKAEAL